MAYLGPGEHTFHWSFSRTNVMGLLILASGERSK
jgi:hypothetical protein